MSKMSSIASLSSEPIVVSSSDCSNGSDCSIGSDCSDTTKSGFIRVAILFGDNGESIEQVFSVIVDPIEQVLCLRTGMTNPGLARADESAVTFSDFDFSPNWLRNCPHVGGSTGCFRLSG